jgi:hypothetical protein
MFGGRPSLGRFIVMPYSFDFLMVLRGMATHHLSIFKTI